MKHKRLAGLAVTIAAVASAMVLSAGMASADTTLTLVYPVSGTTHVASTNSDLSLGPGTMTATADLTTGTLSGTITLPDSTGSFTELGIVPVQATVAFTQVGSITGTVNETADTVTATANVELRITDLKVAGIDTFVGPFCQTVTPASITLSSGTGFIIAKGGPVGGTYTIPDFNNCGLLDSEAGLIDLVIPGSGNTISLTLGSPSLG